MWAGNPERTTLAGQARLTCGLVATAGSVSFTVPAGAVGWVDATLSPDAAARGRTATAIRIDRL